MPEAVTTQHETLWIGVNRSAMMRVPYVVSSPEIADPVQPIDATNLASDMRVYIPGIKDYSGDLAWEANSQYYRPGELRDLLAMDGCKVYAERRMPLVGARVSLEGTASVSMSAASPDSVQRVTVRITPSSAMTVEEWTPDTAEGYFVRIRTDTETGMDVVHSAVGYGGRPTITVMESWRRVQGAAKIPHEWDFNGGVGPFGCFYAAFNIDDYVAGTESEEPICTEAGRIAYKLDPYHLRRSLAGTVLAGTYNVLLVIPAVYWRVLYSRDLYMSNKANYSSSISGLVAYAHTATLPGGGTKVFPYIGIGVYEATVSNYKLLSIPGRTPTMNQTHDTFKATADNLTPAAGCDFQMWNFYQWTLFKMMSYAVMGTKNSQWMLGAGPTSGTLPSTTGLADDAGPYADSTSGYSKMFIENPYGSIWEIIGDTMLSDLTLRVGQTLGGANLGTQTAVSGATLPAGTNQWAETVSNGSAIWDLPLTAGATSTASNSSATGSIVTARTGARMVSAGGRWNDTTKAGIATVSGYADITAASTDAGTRLSYFINEYALGLTDEAPAALPMSAPLALSMGLSAPDEEEAEEPAEEPEENYGEEEETPEESEEEPEEDMR